MKFAIKFYRGCRTLQKADEIIIRYNEKSASLIDFVQKWEEHQRIIIDITELETPIEECLTIFEEARKLHKEFAVLLSYNQNYVDLAEMNIPFFFIEGALLYIPSLSRILLADSQGLSDPINIKFDCCHPLYKSQDGQKTLRNPHKQTAHLFR